MNFHVQPMNKRRNLTYNTRTDRDGRTLNHKDDSMHYVYVNKHNQPFLKTNQDEKEAYTALHPKATRPELTTENETYAVWEFIKGGRYEGGPSWILKSAGHSSLHIQEMEKEIYSRANTTEPLIVFTRDIDPCP